jgi:cardiolipin synthase
VKVCFFYRPFSILPAIGFLQVIFLKDQPQMPVLRHQLAAGILLVLLAGCAEVPDIAPPQVAGKAAPQIEGRRGPLTAEQSKAILQRISSDPGDAGLLARHTAYEEAISDSPLIAGNRTRLLRDGPETFKAMFSAIEGATSHVNLEYYIFEDVESEGAHLGDLLIAKRQAGVAVNVIYDSFGSGSTATAFLDRLKQAGINLVSFNPVNPLEAKVAYSLNDRDHRKILVVDGRTAIIGGVNLSTAYQSNPVGKSGGPPGSVPDQWRDTDLEITGPAVPQLQKLFLEHWTAQKGAALDTSSMFPAPAVSGKAVMRVLGSTPDDQIPQYYITLLTAIRTAEKSVKVSAAYFAPTKQEMDSLMEAARRGVDVRLLLPGKSDSDLSIAVAHSHYSQLLDAGVKIYETKNVILHSKTVVVDGVWSAIGSSNFDHRSVIYNDEVDAVVLGSDAAQEMEDLFQANQAAAQPVESRAWKSRPVWLRLKELYSLAWENLL